MIKNLWGKTPNETEINIPTLGVCGEFGCGKTLFGLMIAPGVHLEKHPFAGKNRTLVIDAEKSSVTYHSAKFPFDRIDAPDELVKKHKGTYSTIQMYEWLRDTLDAVKPEQYDVIFIDPITDFDSGLTEYVKANITKFGMTQNQLAKAPGLMWPIVKEQWNLLLNRTSTKCQTLVFAAHMGQVFVGGVPTPKREPKGKETLTKLASIYLELSRQPGKDNIKPTMPSGRILKGRISEHIFDPATGEITSTELLPDVIPVCTPAKIREYIAKPFVGKNVVSDAPVDDNIILAFKLELEKNRNQANQGELEILQNRRQILEMQQQFESNKENSDAEKTTEKSEKKSFGKNSTATKNDAALQNSGSNDDSGKTSNHGAALQPPVATNTEEQADVATAGSESVSENSEMGEKENAPTLAPLTFPFPPLSRDNEIVKQAVSDGLFSKEQFTDFLKSANVTKLSDLSDKDFYKLSDAIEYLKVIRVEMELKKIGYQNVTRFAEQVFQLKSPLEMTPDQFEKMRLFIDQQGKPEKK